MVTLRSTASLNQGYGHTASGCASEVDVEQHQVLILGGGNGGISAAARLLRDGASDVAVMDGASVHRYRPLLNYVGAGQASIEAVERPMRAVVPDGCRWIPETR